MTLNTSSKICISKRLTITALLLIAIGFSIIVFSTLSSSVNKTTSSKAAGSQNNTLIPIGGWGNACEVVVDNISTFGDYKYPELKCNDDADLTCVASLDFYLKAPEKRKSYNETKCLKYSEVPMGKEGTLCLDVPERTGQSRCEKNLVCAKALDNEFTGLPPKIIKYYLEYLYQKYDSTTREKLIYSMSQSDADKNKKLYLWSENFIQLFRFLIINFSHAQEGFLKEPPGICIPNSLSITSACGEIGDRPCVDEGGQKFCSNNLRVTYSNESVSWGCTPNIKIERKRLFECDNRSSSCNEYCISVGSKCDDTCEMMVVERSGDEYYTSPKRGGSLQTLDDGSQVGGKCSDIYNAFTDINGFQRYPCSTLSAKNLNCCCDKIK